jgi:hypothetical protein
MALKPTHKFTILNVANENEVEAYNENTKAKVLLVKGKPETFREDGKYMIRDFDDRQYFSIDFKSSEHLNIEKKDRRAKAFEVTCFIH